MNGPSTAALDLWPLVRNFKAVERHAKRTVQQKESPLDVPQFILRKILDSGGTGTVPLDAVSLAPILFNKTKTVRDPVSLLLPL